MEKRQTILVVAEKTILIDVLGDALQGDDILQLRHAAAADAALKYLEEDPVDVVLLCAPAAAPDPQSAISALWHDIRAISPSVPIVVMTTDPEALRPPGDEAEDAWDAVVCPVRLATLMAVLRASLVREGPGARSVVLGPFHLDPGAKVIEDGEKGTSVRLTEKETAILVFLSSRIHGPVARDTLLGEVWGYNDRVTTHTLETHIYRLRRKLEALGPEGPGLVHTEPGGYRLNVNGAATLA